MSNTIRKERFRGLLVLTRHLYPGTCLVLDRVIVNLLLIRLYVFLVQRSGVSLNAKQKKWDRFSFTKRLLFTSL